MDRPTAEPPEPVEPVESVEPVEPEALLEPVELYLCPLFEK